MDIISHFRVYFKKDTGNFMKFWRRAAKRYNNQWFFVSSCQRNLLIAKDLN